MNKIKEIIGDLNIYYINLDRSLERKERIEKIFIENNLNFKRISGIDGKNLDFEDIKKKYSYNTNMNIYEIGCALSHMKAIQTAFDDGLDNVIIMEDDCNFEYIKYKNNPINELIKLNNDWDIIQLGSTNTKKKFEYIIKSNLDLVKIYDSGAFAYIINRKGMEKILNNFAKNHLEVSEIMLFTKCNTYITKPYFTYFNYKELPSYIRENSKSAFTTQRVSKMLWDEHYSKT
jgi:glycosyl transferase family 25